MALLDIEYGWFTFYLNARDVRFGATYESAWKTKSPIPLIGKTDSAEMDQSDDDLKWPTHHPRRKRFLSGHGFMSDHLDEVIIGIPEDKQSMSNSESRWSEGFTFSVNEIAEGELIGSMRYLDHENRSTEISLLLSARPEFFDDLDQLFLGASNVDAQLEVSVRGWSRLGPIGDREVYIDPEAREPAHIENIYIAKALGTAPRTEEDDGEPVDTPDLVQRQVLESLRKIEASVGSVRSAVFLITGIAVATAVLTFL